MQATHLPSERLLVFKNDAAPFRVILHTAFHQCGINKIRQAIDLHLLLQQSDGNFRWASSKMQTPQAELHSVAANNIVPDLHGA